MKPLLPCLLGLVPLPALAQVPPTVAGYTYLAKMGEACAETNTGGCWKTFFYRLRFGRDSVAVTWLVQAVCSGKGEATTTHTDTIQTQRYPYYLLGQPREVAIPGCRLSPLSLAADGLAGQCPPAEGGGPLEFKLDTLATRP